MCALLILILYHVVDLSGVEPESRMPFTGNLQVYPIHLVRQLINSLAFFYLNSTLLRAEYSYGQSQHERRYLRYRWQLLLRIFLQGRMLLDLHSNYSYTLSIPFQARVAAGTSSRSFPSSANRRELLSF